MENIRKHEGPYADLEVGHYFSDPGHLMNISWLVGRSAQWDGEKGQVVR